MDARFLDMLLDPADPRGVPVGEGVHVELERVVQEPVDQDRMVRGGLDRAHHVGRKMAVVEDDRHGSASEHVGGSHHQRIADLARDREGFLRCPRLAVGRRAQVELV